MISAPCIKRDFSTQVQHQISVQGIDQRRSWKVLLDTGSLRLQLRRKNCPRSGNLKRIKKWEE